MMRILLSVCLSLFITSHALAYDRTVTIENKSSATVVEMYGSNTGTDDWQEELLEGEKLLPNKSVDVDFSDDTGYCMFDFLFVFEDGSEMEEERFNTCDYGTFTITD